MNDADPSGWTSAEETHRVDVHQTQFLQVQNNPCSAGGNLSLQVLHMLRLLGQSAGRRAMLVRPDSIRMVIPRLSARAAPVEVVSYRNFRIGGASFFQRLLNPRRGTIGVSGGSRAILPIQRSLEN